jgi:hypothetical protein
MTRGGDVIAVAVGTRLDGQAVNFGVPIQVVQELAKSIDPRAPAKAVADVAKETEKKAEGHEVLTNLGISAGLIVGAFAIYFVTSGVLRWSKRRGERRPGTARVRERP